MCSGQPATFVATGVVEEALEVRPSWVEVFPLLLLTWLLAYFIITWNINLFLLKHKIMNIKEICRAKDLTCRNNTMLVSINPTNINKFYYS